jgi:hypothetical protein
LETPFKQAQPPAKRSHNQQHNNGAQSKSGIVPKISKQKMGKMGGIMGFGLFVEKMGK